MTLAFVIVFLPSFALAQSTNAGLVSGIWYSKTPFFVGETIRIYTAVQNQSGKDILGTVTFLNNGNTIGELEFSSSAGRLIEKWIDWKVTEGTHKFQIKLINVKSSSGESVILANSTSGVDEKFADLDTDGDGIGNRNDEDDDGDGISDIDEVKNGTDPLVFNFAVQGDQKSGSSVSKNDNGTTTTIERGREIAENYVVEPAKKATQVVLTESKPVIERIGELLMEKQLEVEKKIEEDKRVAGASIEPDQRKFYEKIQDKLPPVFRILYSWLLKFLVLLFSVWWIPLIVFLLVVFRILLSIWRRFRR